LSAEDFCATGVWEVESLKFLPERFIDNIRCFCSCSDMSESDMMQIGNLTTFGVVFIIASLLLNVTWMAVGMLLYLGTFVTAYAYRKVELNRGFGECKGLVFHALVLILISATVFVVFV